MPYINRARQRAYQLEWINARRDAWFAGKVCYFCGGELVRPVVHHLNPETKESSRIWSWRQERREAELAKCVAACEDCHVQYHAALRRSHEHGSRAMYSRGCRCSECRGWNCARTARQRAARKASASYTAG